MFGVLGLVLIIDQNENHGQNVRNGYTCHGNVLLKFWIGTLILGNIPVFVKPILISHQT
jgi:hypothetical protein